jgi:hypothetical protein
LWRAVVDQRVSPVQIAQRPLESMPSPLEYEPFMLAAPAGCHSEPKLKRHIEAGDAPAETDSRKVVE